MAQRWQVSAQFYIVYTREAHPKGGELAPYKLMTEMMRRADTDGDNVTTRAEFKGPSDGFEPLDINNDGVIKRHELLASHRVQQFAEVDRPTNLDERMALARRFRAEIPGRIPVVVDDMKHSVRTAYRAMDNSAFIIGTDGRITHRFKWAYVPDIDAALAKMLGTQVPTPALPKPNWQALAADLERARVNKKPVLIKFTTPGCLACQTMAQGTLADESVQASMNRFEVVEASLESDPNWGLFEALGFSGTPAFVVVDAGEAAPAVRGKLQGAQEKADFLSFLSES